MAGLSRTGVPVRMMVSCFPLAFGGLVTPVLSLLDQRFLTLGRLGCLLGQLFLFVSIVLCLYRPFKIGSDVQISFFGR